ncbi:MAG: sodium/solute symporter [Bryobacterales bacterium]|nr:sodium/solute symporter [Bryobacterales bacterium]
MTSSDYVVVALYLVAVVWIGSRFGSGKASLKGFFLGGRTIPWWAAACSGIATMISAVGFIGAPSQAFASDWTYLQARLAWPVAIVVAYVLFIPFFHRLELYTAYEYLERRFDRRTRLVAAAVFILLKCAYTAIAIYAPALVVSEMTGLPAAWVCFGIGGLTTLYTSAGGMRAVIWTDTIQFFVLLAGLASVCAYAVRSVDGGPAEIVTDAGSAGKLTFLDWSTSFETEFTVWGGLIGGTFFLLSQYVVDQAELQRFLTTRSVRGSRRAITSTMVFTSVYGFFVFFVGTALYVYYSQHGDAAALGMDPDRVLPKFVLERLPSGLRGLLLAGIFAASMSTVSSILNSLATVTVRDMLEPFARTAGSVRLARWATLAFGCIATVLSLRAGSFGTILIAQGKIRNFFGGSLVGVFLLGLLSPRANAAGAFWSIVVSFAATAALAAATNVSWMWYGAFAASVSWLVGMGVSRSTKPPDSYHLDGLVWGRRNA